MVEKLNIKTIDRCHEDIRYFGEYMILSDIPTPDEQKEITDELMKKLLNDLKMSGCVKFVWSLDGEVKTVGVKMGAVMKP